jgi:hypothetical protein
MGELSGDTQRPLQERFTFIALADPGKYVGTFSRKGSLLGRRPSSREHSDLTICARP